MRVDEATLGSDNRLVGIGKPDNLNAGPETGELP
jgi:hypothetical protein